MKLDDRIRKRIGNSTTKAQAAKRIRDVGAYKHILFLEFLAATEPEDEPDDVGYLGRRMKKAIRDLQNRNDSRHAMTASLWHGDYLAEPTVVFCTNDDNDAMMIALQFQAALRT